MSLCIITFFTSLKPLHEITSIFVWMFLGLTPTKFVKIQMLPIFLMELLVILCSYSKFLKKTHLHKTTDKKSSILGFVNPQKTLL